MKLYYYWRLLITKRPEPNFQIQTPNFLNFVRLAQAWLQEQLMVMAIQRNAWLFSLRNADYYLIRRSFLPPNDSITRADFHGASNEMAHRSKLLRFALWTNLAKSLKIRLAVVPMEKKPIRPICLAGFPAMIMDQEEWGKRDWLSKAPTLLKR